MEALGWPQLLRNSANRTKIQQNCISGPRKANKNKACSTKIILGGWPGWLCGENVVSRSLPGIPWAIPGCHYSRVLCTHADARTFIILEEGARVDDSTAGGGHWSLWRSLWGVGGQSLGRQSRLRGVKDEGGRLGLWRGERGSLGRRSRL